MGTFDPDNPFHPCKAVLDALRVEGVTIIDPGSKPDADDVTIKGRLRYLADLCDSACDTCCNKHCVALVANDSDFAPEVKKMVSFFEKSQLSCSSLASFSFLSPNRFLEGVRAHPPGNQDSASLPRRKNEDGLC